MLEDIQFNTSDPNITIHIFSVSIKPNIHATIEYRLTYKVGGGDSFTIKIDGDDYKKWSIDDRYLFIYIANKHNLKYIEKVEPEFIERRYCLPNEDGTFRDIIEQMKNPLYTGLPPIIITHENIIKNEEGEPLQTLHIPDNRSVHNDADVAKIETLQTELESQKTKLNQIMSLLGKNNLI